MPHTTIADFVKPGATLYWYELLLRVTCCSIAWVRVWHPAPYMRPCSSPTAHTLHHARTTLSPHLRCSTGEAAQHDATAQNQVNEQVASCCAHHKPIAATSPRIVSPWTACMATATQQQQPAPAMPSRRQHPHAYIWQDRSKCPFLVSLLKQSQTQPGGR